MGLVQRAAESRGVPISYRVSGDGPTVLFVHGAGTTSSDWVPAARLMRDHCRVVTMDRRGRGNSGDGGTHSLALEAQDILAVAAQVDSALIVAHSYGALCAMVAANTTDRVRSLVLYEPPINVSPTFAAAIGHRVASGNADGALADFLLGAGIGVAELRALRESPIWTDLVSTARLLPRELESAIGWTSLLTTQIRARTLYLLGGQTTDLTYLGNLDAVQECFADAVTESIPDQKHLAHVLAPEDFAERVTTFLDI